MARGSLAETHSHLVYDKRVRYIHKENAKDLDKTLNELYSKIKIK